MNWRIFVVLFIAMAVLGLIPGCNQPAGPEEDLTLRGSAIPTSTVAITSTATYSGYIKPTPTKQNTPIF